VLRIDGPALLKFPVGTGNCVWIDSEVYRDFPYCGKLVTGLESAGCDCSLYLIHELPVDRDTGRVVKTKPKGLF